MFAVFSGKGYAIARAARGFNVCIDRRLQATKGEYIYVLILPALQSPSLPHSCAPSYRSTRFRSHHPSHSHLGCLAPRERDRLRLRPAGQYRGACGAGAGRGQGSKAARIKVIGVGFGETEALGAALGLLGLGPVYTYDTIINGSCPAALCPAPSRPPSLRLRPPVAPRSRRPLGCLWRHTLRRRGCYAERARPSWRLPAVI